MPSKSVTSASLLVPMPFFSVYRASKAALSAFGESLRSECAPHGIRLLEVLPGAIDTEMLAESTIRPETAAHAPYRAQAERIERQRAAAAGSSTPVAEAAASIVDVRVDFNAVVELLGRYWLAARKCNVDPKALFASTAALSSSPKSSCSGSSDHSSCASIEYGARTTRQLSIDPVGHGAMQSMQ